MILYRRLQIGGIIKVVKSIPLRQKLVRAKKRIKNMYSHFDEDHDEIFDESKEAYDKVMESVDKQREAFKAQYKYNSKGLDEDQMYVNVKNYTRAKNEFSGKVSKQARPAREALERLPYQGSVEDLTKEFLYNIDNTAQKNIPHGPGGYNRSRGYGSQYWQMYPEEVQKIVKEIDPTPTDEMYRHAEDIVRNHEVDHYLRPASHIGITPQEFNATFNPREFDVGSNYFQQDGARETTGRMSQLLDYFGFKGEAGEQFTEKHLDYAIENYVKDTKMDNNMTEFFRAIKDKELFVKLTNNRALQLTGAAVVGGALVSKGNE